MPFLSPFFIMRSCFCIGIGSNFILGGQTCKSSSTRGGLGVCPPPSRKIWNFTHSEIVSRAILQELDDMLCVTLLQQSPPVHCCSWNTKVVAQLGLEGSGLDRVHGLVGSPVLKSTGSLLSPPTQPILEVVFTRDVCSLHVHEAYITVQRSVLYA